MGGKPGTSRGCGTCRRRKKGCDLMRPICGQCLKSNLICTGYDKESKWIDQTKKLQPEDHITLLRQQQDEQKKSDALRLVLMPKLPTSFDRSAARDGMYGDLMQHWEPQNDTGRRVERFMRGGWILDMPRLATEDALIACAFDALSLIRLGNLSKDRSILERSEVEYGKALRVVRAKLLSAEQEQRSEAKLQMQVQKRGRSPEHVNMKLLLSAVLLLGQYEILSASREKAVGWMTHTQAALALHQQCLLADEDDELSSLAEKFKTGLRIDSIIRAISTRSPKLLMPPSELLNPPEKLEIMFRIMEQIPAILQKTEELPEFPTKALPSAAADIADGFARIFAKFDAWRQIQETSVIDSGYWYEERQPIYQIFSKDEGEPITRRCIWFSDLETATAYSILWSGIMVVCINHLTTLRWLASVLPPSTLATIHQYSSSTIPTSHIFSYISPLLVVRQAQDCVTNINLSLEYFCQPDVGSLTGRIISFPIALAMGWELRGRGMVDVRTTEALKLLRERDGVPMDTFLAGIHKAAETKPRDGRDLRGSKSRLA